MFVVLAAMDDGGHMSKECDTWVEVLDTLQETDDEQLAHVLSIMITATEADV